MYVMYELRTREWMYGMHAHIPVYITIYMKVMVMDRKPMKCNQLNKRKKALRLYIKDASRLI